MGPFFYAEAVSGGNLGRLTASWHSLLLLLAGAVDADNKSVVAVVRLQRQLLLRLAAVLGIYNVCIYIYIYT